MFDYASRIATLALAAGLVAATTGCNDRELITLDDYRPVTELHLQGGGNIDVLWVVDNSGSMEEEQAKLANNFAEFAGFLHNLDYDFHMSVITTDLEDPSMRGRFQGSTLVMTPDTPNLNQAFVDAALVGDNGNKRECGLKAAQLALSEPLVSGHNAGFLREDALLAVIVVTDEDDCGSEDDRPPQPPVSDYVDFFSQLKGDSSLFSLSVIAGDVPNGCTSSVADAAPGYRYAEMVQATGGTIESICEEDFGPVLNRLGSAISGYADQFAMENSPMEDTLSVSVNDQMLEEGVDWYYDAETNSVVFDDAHIPEGCSQIQIEYWIPASPNNTEPLLVIGDEEAFTCGAVELPDEQLGVYRLDGGAIAACDLASEGVSMSPWRGAAVVAFLLALGIMVGFRRRGGAS